MESVLGYGGDPDMFVVKLDPSLPVMTEKWLLVLLIVGSTSLVFLICFPVDFYLYRRRKRLARERKNSSSKWYRPHSPTRAAQIHAKVKTTNVEDETEVDIVNEMENREYGADRVRKVLKMFKDKTLETSKGASESRERLTEAKNDTRESVDMHDVKSTTEKRLEKTVNRDRKVNIVDDVLQSANSLTGNLNGNKEEPDMFNESPQRTPERKFSNVSSAWSENEDLIQYESKHLQYGAYEPIESMTSSWNVGDKTHNKKCFTIQLPNRNLVTVKPQNVTPDNKADIEVHDVNKRQISDILTPTNKQDSQIATMKENKMESTVKDDDREAIQQDIKLFQKVYNVNKNRDVKSHKSLKHSKSDQCIDLEHFKVKGGRKRNMVTPTKQLAFTESLSSEDSFGSKERTLLFPLRQENSLGTPHVKKKSKKNKKYLKKKRSSKSMPDLSFDEEIF